MKNKFLSVKKQLSDVNINDVRKFFDKVNKFMFELVIKFSLKRNQIIGLMRKYFYKYKHLLLFYIGYIKLYLYNAYVKIVNSKTFIKFRNGFLIFFVLFMLCVLFFFNYVVVFLSFLGFDVSTESGLFTFLKFLHYVLSLA